MLFKTQQQITSEIDLNGLETVEECFLDDIIVETDGGYTAFVSDSERLTWRNQK